jgi:glycosyltransferase involved in cell wall biosynthesis
LEIKSGGLTVLLGVYNGKNYLENLFEQILNQDTYDFNLLIIDNASTDNSYKIAKDLSIKFNKIRFKILQNSSNVGAMGNWIFNLHHVKSHWITMLHQDDFYKPNHISTLNKMIKKADPSVVGVCTTMGSMTAEGKLLNSMPRSSWFYGNLDSPYQFIQNIKSQAVPYPSTAFRFEIFQKTKIPIHSPTFSDTEQTLKMLAYGRFIYTKKETMLYRENPISESHALNPTEKMIGASIALNRVFNSLEFKYLLEKIKTSDRYHFAKNLLRGLEHRLPTGNLLTEIQIVALEKMIEIWGYQNNQLNKLLYKYYKPFASPITLNIINSVGNLKNSITFDSQEKNKNTQNKMAKMWLIYFNLNPKFFGKINKQLLKALYKIIFKFKPNHRWNKKWL